VCGNLAVRSQQFWFGPALAGRTVRLWISTTTVHVIIDGQRVKTLPSRFNELHLARCCAAAPIRRGRHRDHPHWRCWPLARPWSSSAP
jgi:hypothetical protein